MDISGTLAPKSDQQNYDDYLTGPRTVTVSNAYVVTGEQPVVVELEEYPGRPFKPNKSMRRVLAKAWGPDTDAWIGRVLTLFGNDAVTYGGKAVGGIEIAAMSHIDKPLRMPLTAKRGQKKDFTVQPLATPVHRDWAAAIAAADLPTLKAMWTEAPAEYQDAMKARAAEITNTEGAES